MMRNARTAHYPRIAAAFLVHRATASTTTIDRQSTVHGEISLPVNLHFLLKSNFQNFHLSMKKDRSDKLEKLID